MHLMMLSVDLFTEAFAQAFEVFDPKRPGCD
jgi:hypothetical protein